MIEKTVDLPLDVPLLSYQLITAGDLSVLYEAGNLRYIKYGDVEIIRMVYSALRNENWETIIPVIANESLVITHTGTTIGYTAVYNSGNISYEAIFEISIDHHNTIRFLMKGTALSSFTKNRIGICILHPVKECVGKKITITGPEGSIYESSFPELISPHQPLKDISRMEWAPADGLVAGLQLSGDIFETEDQRNWGDDSFKTYSTPLSLPFPALVNVGEQVTQELILTVTGKPALLARSGKTKMPPPEFSVPMRMGNLSFGKPLSLNEGQAENYKQFSFQHIRQELKLYETSWQQQLETGLLSVQQKGVEAELIVFFDERYDEQLAAFLNALSPFATQVYSILLLDKRFKATPADLMKEGYRQIKAANPAIPVGYGTDAWFTELNRNRPGDLPHDFVSFCLSPQVHATDTRTVIENLHTLPDIIRTARSITSKPIHISPITVHKRKNPDATAASSAQPIPGAGIQNTSFAAGWILLAIPRLAGAASVTIPY